VCTSKVKNEFIKQPTGSEEILNEKDIEHLPLPVRKYIEYSGVIGKSKPRNVRITFEAKMVSKPGAAPMNATSEQYNFFGSYTRLFLMKASKMLIPFRAGHVSGRPCRMTGQMKKARWSTPVSDYKEIDGRRIPTYDETIWNYTEGDFTYRTFRLKNIICNTTI